MSARRICISTALLVIAAFTIFVSPPANADTIRQTAVKLSSWNFHVIDKWPNADSWGGSSTCLGQKGQDGYSEVRLSDDTVYVKDMCSDGRSAMAKITTYNEAGNATRNRICRNSHGAGTWARCDFNWPENTKKYCGIDPRKNGCWNAVLWSGSYDADTGQTWWDAGNSAGFVD